MLVYYLFVGSESAGSRLFLCLIASLCSHVLIPLGSSIYITNLTWEETRAPRRHEKGGTHRIEQQPRQNFATPLERPAALAVRPPRDRAAD